MRGPGMRLLVLLRPPVQCPRCGIPRAAPALHAAEAPPPARCLGRPRGGCPFGKANSRGGQGHTPAGTSALRSSALPALGAHCLRQPLPPSLRLFLSWTRECPVLGPHWWMPPGPGHCATARAGPGREHVWGLHVLLAGHFRRERSMAATISQRTSQASGGRVCKAIWMASISWYRGLQGRPHPQTPLATGPRRHCPVVRARGSCEGTEKSC